MNVARKTPEAQIPPVISGGAVLLARKDEQGGPSVTKVHAPGDSRHGATVSEVVDKGPVSQPLAPESSV